MCLILYCSLDRKVTIGESDQWYEWMEVELSAFLFDAVFRVAIATFTDKEKWTITYFPDFADHSPPPLLQQSPFRFQKGIHWANKCLC